jgi:hypothetical protein
MNVDDAYDETRQAVRKLMGSTPLILDHARGLAEQIRSSQQLLQAQATRRVVQALPTPAFDWLPQPAPVMFAVTSPSANPHTVSEAVGARKELEYGMRHKPEFYRDVYVRIFEPDAVACAALQSQYSGLDVVPEDIRKVPRIADLVPGSVAPYVYLVNSDPEDFMLTLEVQQQLGARSNSFSYLGRFSFLDSASGELPERLQVVPYLESWQRLKAKNLRWLLVWVSSRKYPGEQWAFLISTAHKWKSAGRKQPSYLDYLREGVHGEAVSLEGFWSDEPGFDIQLRRMQFLEELE